MRYFAHSGTEENGDSWQLLEDHLNNVANLAERFAEKFDKGLCGRLIGLLHDAGKASDDFQLRLRGETFQVDHSTAGAQIAVKAYGQTGYLLSYLIAGHHGGIPSGVASCENAKSTENATVGAPLEERLKRVVPDWSGFCDLASDGRISLPAPKDEGLHLQPPKEAIPSYVMKDRKTRLYPYLAFHAYATSRMLYSSLVDADYLDTEFAMAPGQKARRNSTAYATIDELQAILSRHMENLMGKVSSTPVNVLRRRIYDDCVAASELDPGLFSLTVPTGGGKTLSSMAFALAHAKKFGLDRVIFAIPFTSITSQTAQTLKEIFGGNNVLEHHSNYDYSDLDEGEQLRQRLTVQNWDAPIVVTTNVQLLESLYSNRPSKSRKLHNMAKSVIVLDEAQTLPDHLLIPSLAILEELALCFKSSLVLCTATQPAMDEYWPFGSQPREIVANQEGFEEVFSSRVAYEMLGDIDCDDLVAGLSKHSQVLCILGTKGEALRVYEGLVAQAEAEGIIREGRMAYEEGYFHLSAYMAPAHRQHFINIIKERLREGLPCMVVSTQLIEAGVDVDFPVVYRELAGMESIIQAGGRCNREGKSDQAGTVYVFECFEEGERLRTGDWLEKLKDIARDCIRENDSSIDEGLISRYFRKRYLDTDLDAAGVFKKLVDSAIVKEGFRAMEFEYAAQNYRIIDDDTVSVFVPWGEEGRNLLRELSQDDNSAALSAKIQAYSISLPAWVYRMYCQEGAVCRCGVYSVLECNESRSFYRDDVGLVEVEKGDMGYLAL